MMRTAQKQQGMTAISLLVLLAVGGFFILLLMKLGPMYLENYKVKSVLSNLEAQPNMGAKAPSQIRADINKRFYVNEIRTLGKDEVKIKKVGQVIQVNVDYEVRENIFANVDAVVTFHDTAEFRAH